MIYTSGTTGQPKGVRRKPASPEMQKATGELLTTVFGLRPDVETRTVITELREPYWESAGRRI